MSDKVNVFLTPHTHWDREWYKTFEVFRYRLVEMMDRFIQRLEDGDSLPVFVLDGKAVLLDDYLELRPRMKEKLDKWVKQGKILPGPWFVQTDLFTSVDECIVRNLQWGVRYSEKINAPMKVFYIPESCGVISQAPQIMKNFKIEHAVFIRGVGDEPVSSEYVITGPDGSIAIATYLMNAYNNGAYLPQNPDAALERIKKEVEQLKGDSFTDWILVNLGGDHTTPVENLDAVIEKLKSSGLFGEVRVGSYEDYYEVIKEGLDPKKVTGLEGELRGSRHYPILSGKSSARMDFKLRMSGVVKRLLTLAEPMAAIEAVNGREYPDVLMERVWGLVLRNCHHNTSSGTVIDEVCREADVRLDKAGVLLDEEWSRAVGFLSQKGKNTGKPGHPVVILNTLPSTRSGVAGVHVDGWMNSGDGVKITDEKGEEVEFQVLSGLGKERTPMEILVEAEDIPATGFSVYHLEKAPLKETKTEPSSVIENEFLKVGFEDKGTFYVKDKRTGAKFTNLNSFIDVTDAGDLYNFSPVPGDVSLSHITKDLKMEVIPGGKLRNTLRLSGKVSIPESLQENRTKRKIEWVSCPFVLHITLTRGLPYVDCRLTVDNRAKDHRLSIAFDTQSRGEYVLAGQPFDVVKRDVKTPAGKGWIELPSPTRPFQGFVDVPSDKGSLAVFSNDLNEYEVRKEQSGNRLIFTLFRSVGWLSRGDCITRKVTVAPKSPTPSAQCRGVMNFHYAIALHKGVEDLPRVYAHYQQYRSPLWGAVLPKNSPVREMKGLLNLAPEELVVTCLKFNPETKTVFVRFFNPTDHLVEARISSAGALKKWRKTNMLENNGKPFQDLPGTLPVKPRKIVTLELE